jgi:ubiquinone/menaquinone biosynthesis C-methylase UbiE
VEIREGLIEAIPLPDNSVDVVISNGVLNLSTRKSRVLAEAMRVLRPGGGITIADLVLDEALPEEVLKSPAALAG